MHFLSLGGSLEPPQHHVEPCPSLHTCKEGEICARVREMQFLAASWTWLQMQGDIL